MTGGRAIPGKRAAASATGRRFVGRRFVGRGGDGRGGDGRRGIGCGILAGFVLLVAGCSIDPYERTGLWRPRGSNDGNLAAQVADPNDLVRGKETASSDGVLAAAAIDRLHRGKVKELATGSFQSAPFNISVSNSGGGSSDADGSN